MKRRHRLSELLYRLEDWLLVGTFSLMLLLGSLQIVLRNFLDMGLPWNEPLLRALVLWLALQGAMIAARDNRHIRIDLLNQLLPGVPARWAGLLVNLVSVGICGVMVYAGCQLVILEHEGRDTLIDGLPLWVVQVIIPLAFTVMGLRFLGLFFSGLRQEQQEQQQEIEPVSGEEPK